MEGFNEEQTDQFTQERDAEYAAYKKERDAEEEWANTLPNDP